MALGFRGLEPAHVQTHTFFGRTTPPSPPLPVLRQRRLDPPFATRRPDDAGALLEPRRQRPLQAVMSRLLLWGWLPIAEPSARKVGHARGHPSLSYDGAGSAWMTRPRSTLPRLGAIRSSSSDRCPRPPGSVSFLKSAALKPLWWSTELASARRSCTPASRGYQPSCHRCTQNVAHHYAALLAPKRPERFLTRP